MSHPVSLMLIAVLLAGCAQSRQPRVHPVVRTQAERDAANREYFQRHPAQRPTVGAQDVAVSDQDKSAKLEPGMDRQAVQTLLGPPAFTEMSTFGAATPEPWQGLVWIYPSKLRVTFANHGGNWYLNDWRFGY